MGPFECRSASASFRIEGGRSDSSNEDDFRHNISLLEVNPSLLDDVRSPYHHLLSNSKSNAKSCLLKSGDKPLEFNLLAEELKKIQITATFFES